MLRFTRTRVDLAMLASALLLVIAALMFPTRAAKAFTEQYRVYPGLDGAALYQYGAHFDEGANYLARDFHYSGGGDGGSPVYLRVQLSAAQSPALVFQLSLDPAGCEVDAQAGYWSGSTFIPYTGETYHYIHIAPGISGTTYTSGVSLVNASVYTQVGTVASPTNDPGCVEQSPQLHQSANVGVSTPVYRNIIHTTGETCWTDSYSGNTWQCPFSYKTHVTSPNSDGGCGSYSGISGTPSGLVYGPPAEYSCEEWSYIGQTGEAAWGPSDKVFYVLK